MPFVIENLDCNIFGDFKTGDNAVYNAALLSDLVEANEGEQFNKPIVLQAASLIEVAAHQIFYRASSYNREGVPNINEADRQAIAERQIDKFTVIIDNLRKYHVLDELKEDIYDEFHRLRKYRNKIHVQLNVDVLGASRDEDRRFTAELVHWAVDLCWRIHQHLEHRYARPQGIRGNVAPLRLPRAI